MEHPLGARAPCFRYGGGQGSVPETFGTRHTGTDWQRTEGFPPVRLAKGDPSLRLKNGCARDDALKELVQLMKSAMPSVTNWTAMAKIKKPNILLIAPTALGPSLRTSGPPSQKKRTTLRAIPAIPMTMPT